jgi:class 3 adenylate cyclase
MQQIADWLETLSEYARRFAENHIDFSVPPKLTDQDLKDLGVVLGDRRKLLRAIADLNGIEKIQSKPTQAAKTAFAPTPQDSAVRRQVTVMFSELVGSTALSTRMDPRTCARSSRPIRSASPGPCSSLAGSLRSTALKH